MFMLACNPCLESFHLPKLKHYAPLNNNFLSPSLNTPETTLTLFVNLTALSISYGISLVAQAVKNLPPNAGDLGSVSRSGRCPAGGHGNPLQYSCLENPMDRGAWLATVQYLT